MKFGKRSFFLFCLFLLLVLAPGFYTYIKSNEYLDFFIMNRRVWEELAVLMLSVLSLIFTFFVRSVSVSLMSVVFLADVCILLEPVYVFTVLPPLMLIWSSTRAKKEKFFFEPVTFGTAALAVIGAVIAIAGNVNDFIDFYYLHHRAYSMVFAVLLTVMHMSFLLWRKQRQSHPHSRKTSRKKSKSREQAERALATELLMGLMLFILIVLDSITVVIHGIYGLDYYVFSMTAVAFAAVFIINITAWKADRHGVFKN